MTRLVWLAVVASGVLVGLFASHQIRARSGARELDAPREAGQPSASDTGGGGGAGPDFPAATLAEGAGPLPPETIMEYTEPAPVADTSLAAEAYQGWQADPARGTSNQATGGKLHPTTTGGNDFAPASPATIAPLVPRQMRDPAVVRPGTPYDWRAIFQAVGFNPYTGRYESGGKRYPTATG